MPAAKRTIPAHRQRWNEGTKRLLTTATTTFPPGTAGMREDKLGTDLYWYLVYDKDGYLPYSFDVNGFFGASGHNVGGVLVMQNVVDFGLIANGITLGHAAWKGPNSLGNYHTYSYVLSTATDVTAASMDSTITVGVMSNVTDPNNGSFLQPNVFYTFRGDAFILPVGTSVEGANGNLVTLGNYIVRGIVIQGTGTAALDDVNFVNNSMSAWVDLSGATKFLKFKVKDNNGVIRTGSVAIA